MAGSVQSSSFIKSSLMTSVWITTHWNPYFSRTVLILRKKDSFDSEKLKQFQFSQTERFNCAAKRIKWEISRKIKSLRDIQEKNIDSPLNHKYLNPPGLRDRKKPLKRLQCPMYPDEKLKGARSVNSKCKGNTFEGYGREIFCGSI